DRGDRNNRRRGSNAPVGSRTMSSAPLEKVATDEPDDDLPGLFGEGLPNPPFARLAVFVRRGPPDPLVICDRESPCRRPLACHQQTTGRPNGDCSSSTIVVNRRSPPSLPRAELGTHGLNRWTVKCLDLSRKRGIPTDKTPRARTEVLSAP